MARRANSSKKKGSGFSVSTVFDVASSAKESLDSMDAEVRIRVHVGTGVARGLVLATKEALTAERPGGSVEVMGLEVPAASAADPDAVVVLAAADEPGAGPLVRYYLACGVPCALVAESALDADGLGAGNEALFGVVSASTPDALPPKLGAWLASQVDNKVALAANFACCRQAVIDSLAKTCAAENAAIGAFAFIPGSDFPLMTVSQAKLALDIAAAYGRGVEPSRAAELVGVVGLGLAYRGLARTVAGLVPGAGWALKGAMGFAGTLATAKAVQARFEAGDLLGKRAEGDSGKKSKAPSEPVIVRLPAASGDAEVSGRDAYLVIGDDRGAR
ncbi:hypothetical protein [Paratractidigestivibacter sp.]|uniref:hypothetical protein n=1 Tax=Paratractidigestivibacter sp. TaxID=2847316 RepID=UPI002ACB0D00|nr:hypothetical protein [Paratractidigestivibacter sp.]